MNQQFEDLRERQSRILDYEFRLSERRAQLYLAEYNEHLHNIRDRVQIEQSILSHAVILTAALIPASIQIIDHRAFVAFFFVPFVFITMAVLALRQDLMITTIAKYNHSNLCPRLRMVVEDHNAFRLEEKLLQLRTSWAYFAVGVARYALFGIPSVFSLIAVPYFKRRFGYVWMSSDSIFAVVDSITLVVVSFWIAKTASKSYLSLTRE